MSTRKPRPCKCGCGQDTGSRHRSWVEGHYDFVVRSDTWERTRRAGATKKRTERFRAILRSLGPRVTEGEMVAAFRTVERDGYRAGFVAGQKSTASQRGSERDTVQAA